MLEGQKEQKFQDGIHSDFWSIVKLERVYEAISLREHGAFTEERFPAAMKTYSEIVNSCGLSLASDDAVHSVSLTALLGLSWNLWNDVGFAEKESRKAEACGDIRSANNFHTWGLRCRTLASHAEELLAEYAEADWSFHISSELGTREGRRFMSSVGMHGVARRLQSYRKSSSSDTCAGLISRVLTILAADQISPDDDYYIALSRFNELGCRWIWHEPHLAEILDPVFQAALKEARGFLGNEFKRTDESLEDRAYPCLRFLAGTKRPEVEGLIDEALLRGSSQAAACLTAEGSLIDSARQILIADILRDSLQAEFEGTARTLLENVFALTDERGPQRIQKAFLKRANGIEIDAWLNAMEEVEVDMQENFGLEGISTLRSHGVKSNSIREFVRKSYSYYDSCFIISDIVEKFDAVTIEHLFQLYDGDASPLMRVIRLYDPEPAFRMLDLNEIRSAKNLRDLADEGSERLKTWAGPRLKEAQRRMLEILASDPPRSELAVHCELTTHHFGNTFGDAIARLQRCGGGLSARVLASILEDQEMLRSFSGRDDGDLRVPATLPVECRLTDISHILDMLFAGPMWEANVDAKDPRLERGPYRKVNRGALRKRILKEAFFSSESLRAEVALRLPQQRQKRLKSLLAVLRESETAQASLQSLLHDESFLDRVVAPALSQEGIPVKYVSIRIALKSDFQGITALDQLTTCAGLGKINNKDFQTRLDNSLLLVDAYFTPGSPGQQNELRVVAAGPVWCGNDAKRTNGLPTLIQNNGHIAPEWRKEAAALNTAMRTFMRAYCKGRVPYIFNFISRAQFAGVHIGATTGELPSRQYPRAPLIFPIGSCPKTAGLFNRGFSDCRDEQRLWVSLNVHDGKLDDFEQRMGWAMEQ